MIIRFLSDIRMYYINIIHISIDSKSTDISFSFDYRTHATFVAKKKTITKSKLCRNIRYISAATQNIKFKNIFIIFSTSNNIKHLSELFK